MWLSAIFRYQEKIGGKFRPVVILDVRERKNGVVYAVGMITSQAARDVKGVKGGSAGRDPTEVALSEWKSCGLPKKSVVRVRCQQLAKGKDLRKFVGSLTKQDWKEVFRGVLALSKELREIHKK